VFVNKPTIDQISALVKKNDAPLYVYDLSELEHATFRLRTSLPADCGLYYSVKSNPNNDVIACTYQQGCHIEISSSGELDRSLAAGVDPVDILVTGPGKSEKLISACIGAGVSLFSAESKLELQRLDNAATKLGATLRIILGCNQV